ncbi:hypothetical protein QJS10_CPA03g02184 [Acorus calamus]|uniref:Anaphase-promoting complex subunit 4-like WD40 domain-containing protein n=1 Tax=Acorus calamus TaxID=4465 RepID=A0AAV9F8R7_ACOCL|nr:hypothetical protein QJS10_CPA03g02184 [Acorus calamus]
MLINPSPSSEARERKSNSKMPGGPSEREERVSMELTEEIVKSMEPGAAFRDYTINSKKYGVDLVCFTSHPTTVLYSSKNGWDELLLCHCVLEGNALSSGSLDRTVLLWDQRADKSQGPFDIFSVGGDDSEANVVKFSNDGRLMLLTTTDGHIHILDSFRGTAMSTYNVKPVSASSTLEASFSPDGAFVISGSGDGTVHVWSVRSGKVACWPCTAFEPPVIKWAPSSLMFATGSTELLFWVPDLSKLGSFVGMK